MHIDYATSEITIHRPIDEVFAFIARGAQYHRWHFDYHLRAEPLDLRPGGVGSVFSIEELIDGFYLHHVGHVVRCETNRRFTWRGRFALNAWIWIGTDFRFFPQGEATRVEEVLYFELSPPVLLAVPLYAWRRAFRPEACRRHMLDELAGIKAMLESGDHAPEDVTNPFTDPVLLAQVKRYRGAAAG